jgi:RNA polymerase sigma-70 factor (ECF subfamily)
VGFEQTHIELANMDENDLVGLARGGDKLAFGELYERYVTRIYNYFFYRTGHHEEAEDLTARVFFRALKHIGNYDDRGVPFSAWLFRIAHNLVANWHRDNSRRKIITLDDYIISKLPSDAPELLAETNEQKAELLDSVRELSDDRQQLLYYKFVERLSNADIGDIMGRTEGAVKSLYHRTLTALHEDLDRRELLPQSAKGRRGDKRQQS